MLMKTHSDSFKGSVVDDHGDGDLEDGDDHGDGDGDGDDLGDGDVDENSQ